MKFRPDIQGLRALAVLSVLLFHVEAGMAKGGFVGVDVFFVISGYLITKQILNNLSNGTFSLVEFYKKRARRLLPALFATIALTFAGAFVLFTPKLFHQFGKSALASVFSVSNILFWTEAGYFDTAGHLKPLLHMWSLSVEEQFYLVWPLSLLLLWRARWPIGKTLAVAGVASFAAFIVFPLSQSDGFYLMPFRVFQFAAGAAVIWLERYRVSGKTREVLLFAGLALIIGSVNRLSAGDVFPGVNALPPTLGAALAIYAGMAKRFGIVLRNPVAVWIGTISYSLYLAHWPLIVFYGYQSGAVMSRADKAGLLAASFAAGTLLFYGVEKRFRNKRRPVRIRSLAAFASVLGVLCASLAWSSGWTWRLDERQRNVKMTAEYGGQKCVPPRCSSGPADKPADFYVIGDSHSRAYYTGFVENFPGMNIVFYESSGCPFYSMEYTIYYEKNPEEDRKCRTTRQRAFDEIKASPAPVVVAQNWEATDMISQRTDLPRKSSPNMNAFVDFIAGELRKMREEIAPELYVIGNVPTTGGRMPPEDCIARPFFVLDCGSASLSNYTLVRRAQLNKALSEKISGFARFLDPFESLCDGQRCLSVQDNRPLYSDNRHLSELGSVIAVKGFKTQLSQLK